MQLPSTAPIRYIQHIEINAPLDAVWSLMSDIAGWPSWNPEITAATLIGELRPGSTFRWKAGPGTIVSTLEAVEPGKLIAWSGKTMGIKAVHIWRIAAGDGFTLVTTEESWSGLPARLFKGYSHKTLQHAVDSGLQLLKSAAEAHTR